jgi:hypothetical protein
MEKYSLTRSSRPTSLTGHQAKAVYSYLEAEESSQTFAQILSSAYRNDYRSLLSSNGTVTVPESLCHHLGNFRKKGLIKIVED